LPQSAAASYSISLLTTYHRQTLETVSKQDESVVEEVYRENRQVSAQVARARPLGRWPGSCQWGGRRRMFEPSYNYCVLLGGRRQM